MAAVVAAGLPKAIRSNRQINYPSIYKTELQYGVPDQLIYELGLYHSTLSNLANAKEEEKAIGLKVKHYETATDSAPQTGEFKYIIQKCELIDKDSNLWKITTKADISNGDYKLPESYPKDLSFLCIPAWWVKITGKNDSVLVSIPYPPKTSSSDYNSGGCFLTTACVAHKGLPDNCKELTVLRLLRNEYMSRNAAGQLLIEQYKQAGPEIVQAINFCDNKAEIYEYMYRKMILPSVELVQQTQYAEATEYYKTFVKALHKQYC